MIAGVPCSIREMPNGRVNLVSTATDPITPALPSTFRDVLEEWGHGWMWRSLRLTLVGGGHRAGHSGCSNRRLLYQGNASRAVLCGFHFRVQPRPWTNGRILS